MRSLYALLTTLLTIVALFALTGWQVTSETASSRLLGRLGASIVELDRWLPAHQEDLELLARDRPEGVVEIRDLPIAVVLPSSTVFQAEPEVLKALITREMGRQLYANGTGAFRESDGAQASLSVTEPVRWTVTLLGSGMHNIWLAILALSCLLLLGAAGALMSTGHTPVHAIAMGALIGAIGSLLFWGLMQFIGPSMDSAVDRETALILKDGAWLGVRNSGGVAFASGVLAFLLSIGRGHGSQYTPAPSRPSPPF